MTYIRITNIVLQTAAEWTASLQVLHTWEAGLESDTGKMKQGNGLDVYSSLSYLAGFGGGGGGPETDPVFTAWLAGPPSLSEFTDDVGYLLASNNLSDLANKQTSRQNLFPSFAGNAGKFMAVNVAEDDIEFITLTGGGDLLSTNNLSDVANAVTALANLGISGTDISNWNAAFGWGNHALAGYLTSFTEADPIFTAWYNSGDPTLSSITGLSSAVIDMSGSDIKLQASAANVWIANTLGGNAAKLDTGALSADRKFSFPDQAGTFALTSDLSSFITAESDPVFTAWLGTNDYLSSSTTSTQNGYFDSINLKDQISPSHYLHITVEDNLTATRNLQINVADGNKLLTITGNVTALSGSHAGTSSGTNTGDQTSIVGITGTKAQFDTACTDGNFLYVGDAIALTDGDYGDVVVSGTGTVFSVESAAGAWAFKGEITPAQITANQDNYNPTGLSTAYRLRIETDNSARSIKGIVGGVAGRRLLIDNIGTSNGFIISHEAGTSTDINRINTPNGVTYAAGAGQSIELIYDGTIQRWRFANNAGTANGTVITGIWPVLSIGSSQVTNTMLAGSITSAKITSLDDTKVAFTDNTTGNFTTTAHGYVPKGTNIGSVLLDNGNWGSQTSTCGVAASPTASQTDNITHGLGRTPTKIRIYGIGTFTSNAAATPTTVCIGVWNSTGNRCVFQAYNTAAITTTQASGTSTTFAIRLDTGANSFITGVIGSVTSTQFSITWTETGTATAQNFLWEAE